MTGVRGGALESPSASPSPMKTWPREEPKARGNQIRRRGAAPWVPEMGRPPRLRRWHPAPHLRRAGNPAAKSSNALRKTHASPLSTAAKIMTEPSTTLMKLARTSRPPGTLSTTPGALLSHASNAMWSGLTSSSRTSARVTMELPTRRIPLALRRRHPGRAWRSACDGQLVSHGPQRRFANLAH
jgi:hypothetical protein